MFKLVLEKALRYSRSHEDDDKCPFCCGLLGHGSSKWCGREKNAQGKRDVVADRKRSQLEADGILWWWQI